MTTKLRLAAPPNEIVHGPGAPKAVVLDSASGAVTAIDKIKSYYKGIVSILAAALVIANELTPVLDFIPVGKHYVTVGIAVLGAAVTFLKANEHWVDDA